MGFPCHASVMLGALLSEVEHEFGSVAKRNRWLKKLQVKVVKRADGPDQPTAGQMRTYWLLPDGNGVDFPTNAPVTVYQSAGRALAQHICEQVYQLEQSQAAEAALARANAVCVDPKG